MKNIEQNSEWLDLESSPRDCTWFIGLTQDNKVVEVHYACNLSGEDQLPFEGYFERCGTYMGEVKLKSWLPFMQPNAPSQAIRQSK